MLHSKENKRKFFIELLRPWSHLNPRIIPSTISDFMESLLSSFLTERALTSNELPLDLESEKVVYCSAYEINYGNTQDSG